MNHISKFDVNLLGTLTIFINFDGGERGADLRRLLKIETMGMTFGHDIWTGLTLTLNLTFCPEHSYWQPQFTVEVPIMNITSKT